MKTFLIILAILVIGGFGWYWYSMNSDDGQTAQNNENTSPPPAGGPTPTPPPAAVGETHTVSITANAFSPKTLAIKVGDTVKFVNNDTKPHWPASGPHPQHTLCAGFDSMAGIKPGESYSYTFTEAKTCPMHDHLNPAIFGSITVAAAADSASTLPPPATPGTPPAPPTNPGSSIKEFSISAKPFEFSVKEIRVKKGDKVKINLTNTNGTHDWRLDEFNAKTAIINAGGSSSAEFTADKTGTFEYYCSVGTHRQMGMIGKLIVE